MNKNTINDVFECSDPLPITINVSNELAEYLPLVFNRLISACNKLSAQLNFQTMTANWYHDEENILTITLEVITPKTYQALFKVNKNTDITVFTDDVFVKKMYIEKPVYSVFIALTATEQQLLNAHPTLSYSLTEKKFTKVINLLADYLAVSKIHT